MRYIYTLQSIGSSIYVALPKEWLKRFSLGKGSKVEVFVDSDGYLKIKPLSIGVEASEEHSVELVVKDSRAAYNMILASYLLGVDTMVVKFESSIEKSVRDSVESLRNILLGLEVLSEDSNTMVLQVLSSSYGDVRELLKSMSRIARSMYLDVLKSLLMKDLSLAESVILRDNNLNRLYFYTVRLLRKQLSLKSIGISDPREIADLRIIAMIIEEIGDDAKYGANIVKEMINGGIYIDMNTKQTLESYVHTIDDVYSRTMKRVLDKGLSISELDEVMSICSEILNKLSYSKKLAKSTTGSYLVTELFSTYESIARRIYDVASLAPLIYV